MSDRIKYDIISPESCGGKTVKSVAVCEYTGEAAVKFTDGTCLIFQARAGYYQGEAELEVAACREDVQGDLELDI